jgi:hypothetical protein
MGVWLENFASFCVVHDGQCEAGDTKPHVDVISHMWQYYAGLFVWITGYLFFFSTADLRMTLHLPSV